MFNICVGLSGQAAQIGPAAVPTQGCGPPAIKKARSPFVEDGAAETKTIRLCSHIVKRRDVLGSTELVFGSWIIFR